MIIYLHMKKVTGSEAFNELSNKVLRPYYYQVAAVHRDVPPSEIKHVFATDAMTVAKVMDEVVRAADSPRSIWQLMINCHGSKGGFISLGKGLTINEADAFLRLKPFMTPGGDGIRIGSCKPAASDHSPLNEDKGCLLDPKSDQESGIMLLKAIARNSGAKVVAGIHAQSGWDWYGPVFTVFPEGNYTVSEGTLADLQCKPSPRQGRMKN